MSLYQPRYFEHAPTPLLALMERVGARVPHGEFIQAVIEVFHEVSDQPEATMRGRFRQSRAMRDFVDLLAGVQLPSGARILAIGCGSGFGGRGPGLAADVVREFYGKGRQIEIDRLEITPKILELPEIRDQTTKRFPLVVSHSLVHYLYEPKPFCDLLNSLLEPGGQYLMANEPNGRFWENPECLKTLELKNAAERRRKRAWRLVDPRTYGRRVARLAHLGRGSSAFARMNEMLRSRFKLQSDLTPSELLHISDPHMPDASSPEFRLGSNGLGWEPLREMIAPLALDRVRTSGYLGQENPDRVPRKWREVDLRMAALHPLDGCSFAALWRKPDA